MATDSLSPEEATPPEESGSATPAPEIRAIEKSAVAKICSGQVVVDLATAVKELVENAVDAGATQVEIKLKEWGVEQIEVSDNGSGVAPKDYQGLTLKYHTSKISGFGDLWSVQSFGFRGEALSSLCEISGSFEVITRTDEQSVGTRLSYDRTGQLLGQEAVARQRGTTISIINLFEPLPVRRAELRRTLSKQTVKLLRVLQGYALVCTGVRITCSNIKGPKGTRQLVLSTQGGSSIRENIVNVFGAKFVSTLQPLELTVSGEEGDKHISGFVSKTGEGVGRSDNDRQFFFLNRRPVDLPRITRLVNEVWRHYEMKHKPAAILNVDAPPGSFDVNVTPDKREVLLVGEAALLEQVKDTLHALWQSANASRTFEVNQAQKTDLGQAQVGTQMASAVVAGSGKKRVREEEEVMPQQGAEAVAQEEEEEEEEECGPVIRRRKGEVEGAAQAGTHALQEATKEVVESVCEEDEDVEEEGGEDENDEGQEDEEEVGADFEGEEELVELPIAALCTGPLRATASLEESGTASARRTVEEEEEEEEQEEEEEHVSASSHRRVFSRPGSVSSSTSAASSLARFRADGVETKKAVVAGAREKQGEIGGGAEGGRWGRGRRGKASVRSPSAGGIRRFLTNFANVTSTAGRGVGQRSKSLVDQLEEEGGDGEEEEEPSQRQEEEEEEEAMSISSEEDQGEASPAGGLEDMDREEEQTGGKEKGHRAEGEKEDEEEVMVVERGGKERQGGEVPRGNREVVVMPEEDEDVVVMEQSTPQRRLSLSSRPHATPTSPYMANPSPHRDETLDSLRKDRAPSVTTFRLDPQAALRKCAAKAQASTLSPDPDSCLSAALSAECSIDPEKGKDCEAAARVFSRVLTKAHFQQMVVLGQFNLGFIIVRVGSDIFILDQHACDEKYNYETLQASTTIHEQRLICPLPIEVSAMEEVVILDNLEVFRQNGFRFTVDEDAPPMKRLQVTALPYSKGVQFGVEDIHELASQLSENPGQLMRLPKIRHMFASRACRMSIMIGKPLTHTQMLKVVRNLGRIEQPWNCPHGRPTMRHLVDLNRLYEK